MRGRKDSGGGGGGNSLSEIQLSKNGSLTDLEIYHIRTAPGYYVAISGQHLVTTWPYQDSTWLLRGHIRTAPGYYVAISGQHLVTTWPYQDSTWLLRGHIRTAPGYYVAISGQHLIPSPDPCDITIA